MSSQPSDPVRLRWSATNSPASEWPYSTRARTSRREILLRVSRGRTFTLSGALRSPFTEAQYVVRLLATTCVVHSPPSRAETMPETLRA